MQLGEGTAGEQHLEGEEAREAAQQADEGAVAQLTRRAAQRATALFPPPEGSRRQSTAETTTKWSEGRPPS